MTQRRKSSRAAVLGHHAPGPKPTGLMIGLLVLGVAIPILGLAILVLRPL